VPSPSAPVTAASASLSFPFPFPFPLSAPLFSPASAAKVKLARLWRVQSPASIQHDAGNADAAVELITGIKKQRTPASGKKEKAPLLGKPQQQQPAAGAASPKIKSRDSPKIESKGGIFASA
jgi:hypothetical protein